MLAARLSEEPERTVCLVEAGPDYGRYEEGQWPSDMLDARTLPMSHLWDTEPGLLVADASIMPTIPRANTNLSTIAVAERIADWLRA